MAKSINIIYSDSKEETTPENVTSEPESNTKTVNPEATVKTTASEVSDSPKTAKNIRSNKKTKVSKNRTKSFNVAKMAASTKNSCNNIINFFKPKNHKNPQIFYTAYTIICTAIIVAIIVILYSATHQPPEESYFVSDDTKTTISLSPSKGSTSSSIKTHVVYTHENDKITSMKTYFEYPDEATAAANLENMKKQPEFTNAELNGKYIVVTSDPKNYENLTVSDVRQQAAAIRQYEASQKSDK